MGTIRRSYAIFRESLQVLGKDKEILIFPLLSGIITIVAFASIVFAGVASGVFQHFDKHDPTHTCDSFDRVGERLSEVPPFPG